MQGGIHKYLESYPDGGKFQGKNFVFDGRVSMIAEEKMNKTNEINEIIGRCLDCNEPHDIFNGKVCCTVCRTLILVCPKCCLNNKYPNEYYCNRHRHLKDIYFTALGNFTINELSQQLLQLNELHSHLKGKNLKNKRRTLFRQMERINERINELNHNNNSESNSIVSLKWYQNPKSRSGWGWWRDEE